MSLPTHTEGYCAEQAKNKLELRPVELIPPTATTVDVKMTHCGLCHTDIHMVDNDWCASTFPMVPGHEGIGVVTAVGEKVKNIAVGDVVGVGWIRDSCRTCKNCMCGQDNVCVNGYTGTFLGPMSTQGCFSRMMRIEERFAFKVPKGMNPASAGPLLCAGATVYTPLREYAKVNSHVGILGLGGLGHLAVKLAIAMGCHVTVLSGSESKREAAKGLGAHHFINITKPEEMKAAANSLDLIVDCAPTKVKCDDYLPILLPNGIFCKCGIPEGSAETSMSGNMNALIFGQKKIVGSIVAGALYMNEMIELCHHHNIIPEVTEMEFSKVNEAFALLKAQTIPQGHGNHPFRIVLKW